MPTMVTASMLALLLLTASGSGQQAADFGGLVVEAGSARGVGNLEVRLTPPRRTKVPVRVTRTDDDGRFRFRQLVTGRYRIEVSQGVHLLYRAEVDTAKTDHVEIVLRRKT